MLRHKLTQQKFYTGRKSKLFAHTLVDIQYMFSTLRMIILKHIARQKCQPIVYRLQKLFRMKIQVREEFKICYMIMYILAVKQTITDHRIIAGRRQIVPKYTFRQVDLENI